MPDDVRELLLTEAALEKLFSRGISAEETEQLLHNQHVTVRNPRSPTPGTRRLLIGRTDGGRFLTLVIEQTVEPSGWLLSPAGHQPIPSVTFSSHNDERISLDRP